MNNHHEDASHVDRIKDLLELNINTRLDLAITPYTNNDSFEFSVHNRDGLTIAFGIADYSLDSEMLLQAGKSRFPNVGLFFSYQIENKTIRAYRRSFSNNALVTISNLPSFHSINETQRNTRLVSMPLGKELETILFEAQSHLRDIDGLHADSALDEICKVIFTKIYDEKTGKQRFSSTDQSIDETSALIRSLYSEAVSHFETLSKTHESKLNSSAFSTGISLSTSALYKLVSELEGLDFSNSPVDIKGRAFQNLISPALRAGMGQYFTPKSVISLIVKCIKPTASENVIDPFCGSAHFLSECAEHASQEQENDLNNYIRTKLYGIDKSDRMVRIGLTDMMLLEGEVPNLTLADSLLDFSNYDQSLDSAFDIVVTNPPFGSILGKDSFDTLGQFELTAGRKSIPLEVVGIERSLQLLKEGGRLAIVLPDSIFLNQSAQYIRDWLLKKVAIKAIISLPIETFVPFGASVKTSILICSKCKPKPQANVFMAQLSDIGYGASGQTNGNERELSTLAKEFSSFIKKEGW